MELNGDRFLVLENVGDRRAVGIVLDANIDADGSVSRRTEGRFGLNNPRFAANAVGFPETLRPEHTKLIVGKSRLILDSVEIDKIPTQIRDVVEAAHLITETAEAHSPQEPLFKTIGSQAIGLAKRSSETITEALKAPEKGPLGATARLAGRLASALTLMF